MHKALFFILLVSGIANAMNFGSTVKIDTLHISEGQEAKFSLLFWSNDDAQKNVDIRLLEKPENWTVEFEKEINISKNEGNEIVYTTDYLMARSVDVKVRPDKYYQGTYSVVIAATTRGLDNIAFAQERIFNLTVLVEGEKPIEIHVPESTAVGVRDYRYEIIFTAIVFISFLVYRYS